MKNKIGAFLIIFFCVNFFFLRIVSQQEVLRFGAVKPIDMQRLDA